MPLSDGVLSLHAGIQGRLQPDQIGRVESLHRHACNFTLAGEWLVLLEADAGPGPGRLLLRSGFPFVTTDWAPGTPTRVLRGPVLAIGQWHLDVRTAALWQMPPPPSCLRAADLAAGRDRLARQLAADQPQQGILPPVLHMLGYQVPHPPGIEVRWQELCRDRVQRLIRALQSPIDAELREAVRAVLGFGPGLTPAGDDLLAGLVFTLARAGRTAAVNTISSALAAAPPSATTPLSRQMLRWAARGEATAHLGTLADAALSVRCVAPDTVRAALAHGATSGADWTAGMLLALTMLTRLPGPIPE